MKIGNKKFKFYLLVISLCLPYNFVSVMFIESQSSSDSFFTKKLCN